MTYGTLFLPHTLLSTFFLTTARVQIWTSVILPLDTKFLGKQASTSVHRI